MPKARDNDIMTLTCLLPVKNQYETDYDNSGHSSDDTGYKVLRLRIVMEEVDRESVNIVLCRLVLKLRHAGQARGEEGRGPSYQQGAGDIDAEREQPK